MAVKTDRRNDGNAKPVTIKYHAGFVSGLEILLWEYREQIRIEPEKWLSTEGIRMDVLILKKDPSVVIDSDIGRIFRGHNILEYKRPDDRLNIDVFSKVMAYVYLYKSQSIPADSIRFEDISATIYRHTYPRDIFRQLKKHGAVIENEYPGVYYIKRIAPFPVQILVGRLFFASPFWKKLQAKMEKVASPKRRKLQAFTVDSYRGSRNRIPVRPAPRQSRGLRGISSSVPDSGIPRSS